jgi:hypothetical protein
MASAGDRRRNLPPRGPNHWFRQVERYDDEWADTY